ncbi:MAG TPA: hypothetical protein DD725_12780, partial [Deltaproteobacteria bacterium]|nr:hypothetical protein [Deltaproteobacteria bacterium]
MLDFIIIWSYLELLTVGKASRKKKAFENRDVKVSDFGEAVLPSIFAKHGFFLALFLITITAFLIYS